MGADAVKKAPENSKILHATKMLEAGQKEVIEFNAPEKPDYEFFVHSRVTGCHEWRHESDE